MAAETPKSPREHEEELLIGIGHQGMAALGVLRNLMRALIAKGVFSQIELAAIFDATVEQARGNGDRMSERFAESMRQTIRDLEGSVLSAPSGKKH